MTCRHCQGAERMFGAGAAKRELRRYRRKGPTGATRVLLEALRAEGVEGATVLDVGGGVGVVQHELLAAGAARAVGVDAAGAYLAAVQEEAARRGAADRVEGVHGDLVDLAGEIDPADVVTLDKVVCCYPDMRALVRLSAGKAVRLYGLVFPRETLLVRAGLAAMNVVLLLLRNPFRSFVHPEAEIDREARESGLELRLRRRAGLVWRVAVYVRPGPDAG